MYAKIAITNKEKLAYIRNYGYTDKCNFFERIEKGETFTGEQLSDMGYDRWSSRNLAHFLATGQTDCLAWE